MGELAESIGQHSWAWSAVLALGAYHGLNPGMGWLFAVSNGMQARRASGVFLALPPIALGHLLAMAAALLPFALVSLYVERLDAIRTVAGLLLVIFGVYKLLSQRHPRFLVRIGPSHLVLWSFLMATAHGAGLMLVPVALGLGADAHAVHGGHQGLPGGAIGTLAYPLIATTLHTSAMMFTGGLIAWVVYRHVGLGLLSRGWVNLDLLWALLLIIVGTSTLAVKLWQ